MTLLDAPPYDPVKVRHRRKCAIAIAVATVIVALGIFHFWNWPAEHRVNQFLMAIQSGNYPKAFAIWTNDSVWQQHASRYDHSGYSYGDFLKDWGPSGEYGVIRFHQIIYTTSRVGNNTLVAVRINHRDSTVILIAVSKKTHALSFTPYDITRQRDRFGWSYWQLSYR